MTTAPIPACSSCVLQATALELTVLLYMKSTATRTTTMTHDWCRRRGGRGTDSGWSTAERRLQGAYCLVAPRDTRLALVTCGHQRFCPSCMEQVKQQQLRCPLCRMHKRITGWFCVCSNFWLSDYMADILTVRPSVCLQPSWIVIT